jgi:hypothetical protein
MDLSLNWFKNWGRFSQQSGVSVTDAIAFRPRVEFVLFLKIAN